MKSRAIAEFLFLTCLQCRPRSVSPREPPSLIELRTDLVNVRLHSSRQGLYIIDLSLPTRVPRFLPQGGLHSVADVQWSPHSTKPHSIVSTSSEKMLLWNLGLPSERGIEREVVAHRRAVTDVNWAVFNDNVRPLALRQTPCWLTDSAALSLSRHALRRSSPPVVWTASSRTGTSERPWIGTASDSLPGASARAQRRLSGTGRKSSSSPVRTTTRSSSGTQGRARYRSLRSRRTRPRSTGSTGVARMPMSLSPARLVRPPSSIRTTAQNPLLTTQ